MPSEVLAMLGVVGAFSCAVLAKIVSDDLRSFTPRLSERLLRSAAELLDPSCADRYLEEWLAHVEETPETTGKLWQALTIRFFGARRVAKIVGFNPRFSGTNSQLIRLLDLGISVSYLPIVLAVMAPIAVVCLLQDGRAVVCTEAAGRDGKIIRVYRFPVPRTGFGQLLYRSSLTELPLLLSVFRGDLSFVGPPLSRVEKIGERWYGARYLRVRPGLTGFTQVLERRGHFYDDKPYLTDFNARTYFSLLGKTCISVFEVLRD